MTEEKTTPDFGGGHVNAHPNLRPQDSASLILVDLAGGRPFFLMGKRSEGHVFLPGYHVFPGGRLERQDFAAAAGMPVHEPDMMRIARSSNRRTDERRARALLRCALRETSEETGLDVTGGFEKLRYVARAITPPRQVRRYDTRFFMGRRDDVEGCLDPQGADSDGELLKPEWLDPQSLPDGKLHAITRFVIASVTRRLATDPRLEAELPVECHRLVRGKAVITSQ